MKVNGAKIFIALLIFFSLVGQRVGFAYGIPASLPLSVSISDAQTIVIARVVAYAVNPSYSPPQPNRSITIQGKSIPFYSGIDAMYFADTLNPPGKYQLEVEQLLKGKCPQRLDITLPTILSVYYNDQIFHVTVGSQVLLLLHSDKQNDLQVVDPTLPLIQLSTKIKASSPDIVSLLLSSLADTNSGLRQIYTFLLRDTINSQVIAGFAPYLDDPNLKVQDNVLYCLAENQQLAAIPRIEALAEKTQGTQVGLTCTAALDNYENTPEAKGLLAPLLFCSEYFTRLHAMFALDHLADRSTIPYLMLAVRDPDEQGIIPQSAYGLLHQLNPSLGEAFGNGYFAQHREAETTKLYAWWSDELLGKHLKPGEHPALPSVLPDTPALLNPLLFTPDIATRRAVAVKLARLGDKSSIPYLILALQDPDAQAPDVNVSYVAYKALHQLIPVLGAAEDSDRFAANHAAATQPIYDWWQDELSGKHLPK